MRFFANIYQIPAGHKPITVASEDLEHERVFACYNPGAVM